MSRAEVGVALLLAVLVSGAVVREIVRRIDRSRPTYKGVSGRVNRYAHLIKKK